MEAVGGRVHSDAVLVAAGIAVCAALALTPAVADDGPVVCPFRLATGIPCPACGSVRAWVHLGEGDVGAALASNPFAVGTFLLAVVLVTWRLTSLARPAMRRPDLGAILATPAMLLVVAAWFTWGAARALGY